MRGEPLSSSLPSLQSKFGQQNFEDYSEMNVDDINEQLGTDSNYDESEESHRNSTHCPCGKKYFSKRGHKANCPQRHFRSRQGWPSDSYTMQPKTKLPSKPPGKQPAKQRQHYQQHRPRPHLATARPQWSRSIRQKGEQVSVQDISGHWMPGAIVDCYTSTWAEVFAVVELDGYGGTQAEHVPLYSDRIRRLASSSSYINPKSGGPFAGSVAEVAEQARSGPPPPPLLRVYGNDGLTNVLHSFGDQLEFVGTP